MPAERQYEIATDFVSVSYSEVSGLREVYGFTEPNRIVVDGVRFVPQGRPSYTLLMYMHPTGTIRRLPVPGRWRRRGCTSWRPRAATRATTPR